MKSKGGKRDKWLTDRAIARADYWARNPGTVYGHYRQVAEQAQKTACSSDKMSPEQQPKAEAGQA